MPFRKKSKGKEILRLYCLGIILFSGIVTELKFGQTAAERDRPANEN
jgi:hypothetical protein